MASTFMGRVARLAVVLLTACGCALAQYGGGGAGTNGGTYTPGKSYGHGALIGGIAAGAGAGALFLALHDRHSTVVGCVAADGKTITAENSKTYQLTGSPVTGGERVSVVGKKRKDASGMEALEVSQVKEDFGQCQQTGVVGGGN
ncbi:MAG: hypothetical protein ACRD3L_12095 [Terriglobales bacterium]